MIAEKVVFVYISIARAVPPSVITSHRCLVESSPEMVLRKMRYSKLEISRRCQRWVMLDALNSCFGVARDIRLQGQPQRDGIKTTAVIVFSHCSHVLLALWTNSAEQYRDKVSHHVRRTALSTLKKALGFIILLQYNCHFSFYEKSIELTVLLIKKTNMQSFGLRTHICMHVRIHIQGLQRDICSRTKTNDPQSN